MSSRGHPRTSQKRGKLSHCSRKYQCHRWLFLVNEEIPSNQAIAYTPSHMSTLLIERHERASLRSRAVAAGIRGVLRPRLTKAAAAPFGPAELRRAAAVDR